MPKRKPARRPYGSGSVYPRKDRPGTWTAEFRRQPDPVTGKRALWRGSAPTREDAERLLRQAMAQESLGQLPEPSRVTVAHWLEHWLTTMAGPRLRPQTLQHYRYRLTKYVLPPLGHLPLHKLSAAHLRTLYAGLLAPTGPLKASSIANLHHRIRTALADAVKAEVLSRNVADLVDTPRQTAAPVEPLTPEQARVLLATAATDRLEALYVLALATGARQGELLALTWDDVDLRRRELRIRRTLQWHTGGGWSLQATKTRSAERIIPLIGLAVEALKRHGERQQFERQHPYWQSHGLVFTSIVGTPIDKRKLSPRSWRPLLERAGLPRVRFHDLRHAAASFLLAEGVPLPTVASILGHSSSAITASTYAHLVRGREGAALEKLGGLLAADEHV